MKLTSLGVTIAFMAGAVDQASKWLVLEKLQYPSSPVSIFPFFDLTLVFNRGVSFGFLSQQSFYGKLGLIILAASITGLMLYWLLKSTTYLSTVGLGLIIGGAIGNIVDRIRLGAVVDFLHFHWGSFSFPAFNLADTWITVGAALVLINEFLLARKSKE